MPRTAALLASTLLAGLALAEAAWAVRAETRFTAFGRPATASVLGLEAEPARRALESAVARIRTLEALADPNGTVAGGLGQLNRAAGAEPVPLDPALFALFVRLASFCDWSSGALSPLGGELLRVWGRYEPQAFLPLPEALSAAVGSAACSRLQLDLPKGQAALAAGTRADLLHLASGWAIDAVVEQWEAEGVPSAFVQIGGVARAFGPGPGAKGWPLEMPTPAGLHEPLPRVSLLDKAYAAALPDDLPLQAGGELRPSFLDHRKGQPPTGVLAVLTLTDLAADAQAMAAALFALGSREGQRRLGVFPKRPSALWVLGSGQGEPLLVEYSWLSSRSSVR
jgi:FAD:protein FMN transferase